MTLIKHDLSKLLPDEFIHYAFYYRGKYQDDKIK